jgi:FKBP-type peptidyl-prolyl cis-trans isomerase FkpA
MKKIVLVLSVGLFALAACSNHQESFKKGEGGMEYIIHQDEKGDTIKVDDYIGVTYTVKGEDGKIIYNSNDYDGRVEQMFRQAPLFKGGFFAGLGMLSEGDSATFKVNLDSAVAREHIPRPATNGKYLIYTVKVNKVVARGQKKDDEYAAAIEAYKAEQLEVAKNQEQAKFNNYIASLKTKPTVTASGLNYVVTKKEKGVNLF